MAKQSGFQKFLRQAVRFIDGVIEKLKKMDRRFLLMLAAAVVLLIVILALIIHSVGSNKTDEEIPSSTPSYIQDEVTTDDEPETTVIAAVGAGKYTVTLDSATHLNIRPSAGTKYDFIARVPNGTVVDVMFVDDSGETSWGYIEYDGVRGWVSMDYLTAA